MDQRDVAIKLDSLENNIRGTFYKGTNFEITECENGVNRAVRNIEYSLNGYRVGSPADIDRMITSLKGNLSQIKTLIEDSRDREKRYTVEHLQRTSIELESAIRGLEEFEVEGIRPTGQDDIAYEEDVRSIIDRQIEEFVHENGIKDPRAVDEIRAEINGLKESLIRNHDKISVDMKYTIKGKVAEIGSEFVAAKGKEDKSDDFASKLGGLTNTEEEIARNDAKELSENEKAFKGNEEPSKSNKEKYESMFK